MKNKDSLMLYIHIPFCERKCDYCDFLSFVTDEDTKAGYFKGLFKQLELKAELAGNIPVSSIFIGGGTPSCVDERFIYDTLMLVRDKYRVLDDAEITMESNPNSIRKEALSVYRNAGINRISMGLQSADNEELKLLSRLHSYEDFLKAYDAVRLCGFDNVNVDLMSGLPGQSIASFEKTLSKVISLKPEHISAYSLIFEEGTRFYERYGDGEGVVDEETDRYIYHMTQSMLKDFGYERYEISNYSRPGKECRHNLGYWVRRPYLGFGPSAASLFDEKRYSMHRDLKAFIAGDFSESVEELSLNARMEEFMFLGLRLTKGISRDEFFKAFNKDLDSVYKDVLEKLQKEGLLDISGRVKLTERGLDLANYAMSQFLLD